MTDSISHSYFVVMVNFGRKGSEAIVDPEMTSRGAVDLVRDMLAKGKGIDFVHHIKHGEVEDVTDAVLNASLIEVA
jgi:hypothetical protein